MHMHRLARHGGLVAIWGALRSQRRRSAAAAALQMYLGRFNCWRLQSPAEAGRSRAAAEAALVGFCAGCAYIWPCGKDEVGGAESSAGSARSSRRGTQQTNATADNPRRTAFKHRSWSMPPPNAPACQAALLVLASPAAGWSCLWHRLDTPRRWRWVCCTHGACVCYMLR